MPDDAANHTRQQLANLQDEREGAALYAVLAEVEENPNLAEIYRRLCQSEQNHAESWSARLLEAGAAVPEFRPSWRARTLAWLARRFGPGVVLPTILGGEKTNAAKYAAASDAKMAGDEASHARLLTQITSGGAGGMIGSEVAKIEGRHHSGGNALRAAVLGANDGLVSNLSLVMGVAGAAASLGGDNAILITGMAGLLAGACSMALGEWLSVQSSRELYARQIEIEKAEIADSPEDEAEELALIYQSRGVPADQARQLADHIMASPEQALDALVREELAIDPKELGGSAWVAGGTSFALFAIGAIIPVVPFMFLHGTPAIAASAGASMLGLFGMGAIITLFTGKPAWWSGLRMVIFGLAAAAVTFTIGHLIGASIG